MTDETHDELAHLRGGDTARPDPTIELADEPVPPVRERAALRDPRTLRRRYRRGPFSWFSRLEPRFGFAPFFLVGGAAAVLIVVLAGGPTNRPVQLEQVPGDSATAWELPAGSSTSEAAPDAVIGSAPDAPTEPVADEPQPASNPDPTPPVSHEPASNASASQTGNGATTPAPTPSEPAKPQEPAPTPTTLAPRTKTTTTTVPTPAQLEIVLTADGLHVSPAKFAAGKYPVSFAVDAKVFGRNPFIRVWNPDGRRVLRLGDDRETRRDLLWCAGTYKVTLNMNGKLTDIETSFTVVGSATGCKK